MKVNLIIVFQKWRLGVIFVMVLTDEKNSWYEWCRAPWAGWSKPDILHSTGVRSKWMLQCSRWHYPEYHIQVYEHLRCQLFSCGQADSLFSEPNSIPLWDDHWFRRADNVVRKGKCIVQVRMSVKLNNVWNWLLKWIVSWVAGQHHLNLQMTSIKCWVSVDTYHSRFYMIRSVLTQHFGW